MNFNRSLPIASLAACAAGFGASASHAALTVFTSQASFLAAVVAPQVDTFDNLFAGGIPSSPLTRSTGSYGYRAATGPNYPYFLVTTTSADRWLAAGDTRDTVTFASFTGGPQAIGGNFFESQLAPNNTSPLVSTGDMTLTVTDSLGAVSTQTFLGVTPSSFFGFVSTGQIASLAMSDPQKGHMASVDNLTFASAAAVVPGVPEPATVALLLAGFGITSAAAARRRR